MRSPPILKRNFSAVCIFVLYICFIYNVYASSYEEVSKSTAIIVHENGLGSGFFIAENLLVTNYHVVANLEDGVVFFVTQDGIVDAGRVVVTDSDSDLAIIKTSRSGYQALEMGSAEDLEMGDEISVIGFPEGSGGTLSKGPISSKRLLTDLLTIVVTRTLSKGTISSKREGRIQITVPISSGSSGSPVFSKDFKVVGISASTMSEGQNLNFAIPINKLQTLMQSNKLVLEKNNEIDADEGTNQSMGGFDEALESYEAKEDKTPEDMFYIGVQYSLVEEDEQQAIYWFEKAAKQGHVSAQNNLGFMYKHGEGVARDYQKAIYWYEKAANQGNVLAQNNLGVMYYKGEGVAKNYQKAHSWFGKAANQGAAVAQNSLGTMYYKGEGVAKDYQKAIYWYDKAVSQGLAEAQYNLGLMYSEGEGVAKDYQQAIYWYEKAANQGLAEAQNNLGLVYYKGEDVTKNYQKAIYWYEKAAKQGTVEAQFNLGLMYKNGEGVAKNYQKAIYWYEKAANQGYAGAQFNLGLMYSKGESVTQNHQKAIYWYEKAAKQGYASAQYILGLIYHIGKGVAKNYIEAYKWLVLSKAQKDNEKLDKIVSSLEKSMTPSQIAKAQELASQFEPQEN